MTVDCAARQSVNAVVFRDGEPEMSTFQIRFRQPGTASLQKTLTVKAETEEQAIRIARKQIQEFGTGWRFAAATQVAQ
jgi:hypothetical protein